MRTSAKLWTLLGALVVAGLAGIGVQSGLASSAASGPPINTGFPLITGLQVGQTLSVTSGTWTGATPMTYYYTWQRSAGSTFAAIPGAQGTTYTATPADIGHNLLVQVKAQNAAGQAWSTSATTSFVTGPTAADTQPLAGGLTSVLIDHVVPPDRLVIDTPTFAPAALKPGGSVAATFRVVDVFDNPVRGALVQVVALPFGTVKPTAEATTGADGTATMTLVGTATLARVPGGAIALSVRARKQGENVLAGVTGTRLVELKTAR